MLVDRAQDKSVPRCGQWRAISPSGCRGLCRASGPRRKTSLARTRIVVQLAHPRRPRYADGQSAAALLDADRRRQRTRRQSGQAGAVFRRGPDALQGLERPLRADRPPLPTPRCRFVLRLGRGEGIRCFYHGWKFDERGNAWSSPTRISRNPEPKAREGCAAAAYPVREIAGLLWAYMGPQPAPELPVWEPFTLPTAFARSCSPKFPAIGSSARRTPSTRCIRVDARELERAPARRRQRHAPTTSSSSSTSSSTASSTAASAKAATKGT